MAYFEARYSPQLLASTKGPVTPSLAVQAVNRGLQRGQKDFNIKARSILACCANNEGSVCPQFIPLNFIAKVEQMSKRVARYHRERSTKNAFQLEKNCMFLLISGAYKVIAVVMRPQDKIEWPAVVPPPTYVKRNVLMLAFRMHMCRVKFASLPCCLQTGPSNVSNFVKNLPAPVWSALILPKMKRNVRDILLEK